MIDFDSLIAPLDTATFFGRYWEQHPLHVARNAPAYYDALLTVADIDRHIFSNQNLALTPFRFFKGKDEARPPLAGGPIPNVVDHAQVFALLAQGYGMYLNFPERIFPALQAFFQRLAGTLKVRALSHLILSPPNVPGFLPHTDPYGVFVLQLAGEKSWFLYDIPEQPPSAVGRNYHHYTQRPPTQTVVVRAGDLLYLPRGMVHAVATGASHSLHLSLALTPPTGADVARRLLQSLADRPFMRDYVPFGALSGAANAPADAQLFKQALIEAIAAADLSALLEDAHQSALQAQAAPPSLRQLLARDRLNGGTRVQITPGLTWRLIDLADRCVLVFEDQRLEFPAHWRPSLEELFARRCCRIDELGGALPITEAERVQVARNLLRGGFLQALDGDCA